MFHWDQINQASLARTGKPSRTCYYKSLPEVNVSNAKEWYEVRLSPNSAHAKFSCNLLFHKVVFQHTEQEQFAIRSSDAVTINLTIHRDLDVCTESHLDVFICRIPISLVRK